MIYLSTDAKKHSSLAAKLCWIILATVLGGNGISYSIWYSNVMRYIGFHLKLIK